MFKKIIPILPQIIASLFLTGLMVFAWTGPSQTPPGGNVPAPLNVSNIGQSKEGGLILNTGGAEYGLIIDKGKIKISGGQIEGMRAENVSSLPSAGSAGRMVFNTTDGKMYFDNGTSWKAFGTSVALVGFSLGKSQSCNEDTGECTYGGSDLVVIPSDAYQVMCIMPLPPLTNYENWLAVSYQGSQKIYLSMGSMHSGSGHVGAAIWDANGGGDLTYAHGGWWVNSPYPGSGSCYYTKLI